MTQRHSQRAPNPKYFTENSNLSPNDFRLSDDGGFSVILVISAISA